MQEFVMGISECAAKKILEITGGKKKLRISVEGGGCKGFQYKYDLVEEQDQEDILVVKDEAMILIDPISKKFLNGIVLDFVENLSSSAFVIKNPNAKTKCGCGSSFVA